MGRGGGTLVGEQPLGNAITSRYKTPDWGNQANKGPLEKEIPSQKSVGLVITLKIKVK